jgi:hypothetical protein
MAKPSHKRELKKNRDARRVMATSTRRPYLFRGAAPFSGALPACAEAVRRICSRRGVFEPAVSAMCGGRHSPKSAVSLGPTRGRCALSAASGGDYSSMSLSARAGLSFLGLVSRESPNALRKSIYILTAKISTSSHTPPVPRLRSASRNPLDCRPFARQEATTAR